MSSYALLSQHNPRWGLTAARAAAAIVAAWRQARQRHLEQVPPETRSVSGLPRAGNPERGFVEQHLLDNRLGPEIRRIFR